PLGGAPALPEALPLDEIPGGDEDPARPGDRRDRRAGGFEILAEAVAEAAADPVRDALLGERGGLFPALALGFVCRLVAHRSSPGAGSRSVRRLAVAMWSSKAPLTWTS